MSEVERVIPHIISLGAGVQSSTMALLAAEGALTPMPIAAVFADTQREPKSVYRWQEEPEDFADAVALERQLQAVCDEVGQPRMFLHRSLKMLDAVPFASDDQPNLFTAECEGMCGV